MIIRNLRTMGFQHEHETLQAIYINQDGRMQFLEQNSDVETANDEIDARGEYTLMPGMLDAHVHGQGGHDFADADNTQKTIGSIAESLAKTGLAYAMATVVSSKPSVLSQSLKAIDDYIVAEVKNPTPGRTQFVGVHLEGPFIAKNCKGAHSLDALQESISIDKFKQIIRYAPHIKEWKITLAPDLPGAQQFVQDAKQLQNEGIYLKVFIGHSNPSIASVDQAIANGAVGFTHLGNACMEACCREARKLEKQDATSHVVSWVLHHPDKCPPGVELIVDGVHLSASFVQLVKETVGDKIVLVTDALGPAGLKDDRYHLGELAILKVGNQFYLEDETRPGNIKMIPGTLPTGQSGLIKALAGSAVPLSHCIKMFADWVATNTSITTRMRSIYAASIYNPKITSLSQHAIDRLPEDNNFVIFSQDGRLVMSLCQGKIVLHDQEALPFEHKFTAASSNDRTLLQLGRRI